MNLANYSNDQALIIFNLYNSLEECFEAIGRIHPGQKLVLSEDDLSKDRKVVDRYVGGILTQSIVIRSEDVELAKSNPMIRYQLLSYVLNQFKEAKTA